MQLDVSDIGPNAPTARSRRHPRPPLGRERHQARKHAAVRSWRDRLVAQHCKQQGCGAMRCAQPRFGRIAGGGAALFIVRM